MQPTGKNAIPVMFMAEAPGKNEDEQGKQLVGLAGQYLRNKLKNILNIDLDDCRKINSTNCRTPKNRTPTDKEIDSCYYNVEKEIKHSKPKVIVLLGASAVKSVIGHLFSKNLGGLNSWRGIAIPSRHYNAWILVTFHPSYIMRDISNISEKIYFDRDLEMIQELIEKPLPKFIDEQKCVELLTTEQSIDYMKYILEHKPIIAIDYETTGLKPHKKGHEIYSVSICDRRNRSVSFLLKEENKEYLIRILGNKEIKKVAQNMKFEHIWSSIILGVEVQGWLWDTMIASHLLDNRSGITGLKKQVFINFGVHDYDSNISDFLEAESSVEINRVKKIPVQELLYYNALDSLYTYWLFEKQYKEFTV
jgi:uracil-DNA glycosylase family 4